MFLVDLFFNSLCQATLGITGWLSWRVLIDKSKLLPRCWIILSSWSRN